MNKWIIIGLFLLVWSVSYGKPDRFPRKQHVTTTPAKLQLFVDQKTDPYTIKITYTLNIPPDYIRSCARLVYQPYFMAPEHRYNLTPVIIRGKRNIREERRLRELSAGQPDYPDAIYLENKKGDGMKIKLSQTVPFETWMTKSKLRADVILESCDREKHMEVLTLADGVIWYPLGPGPALVKYVKQMEEVPAVSSSYFLYPDGEVAYNRDYSDNARRMHEMMGVLDSLRTNKDRQLQKIVVTGYSSPTGSWEVNEKIARSRAGLLKDRLVQRFRLSPSKIEVKTVPYDWQGLKQLVLDDPAVSDKQEIMQILDGKYSDQERKSLLMKLPRYRYMQEHLFPLLRKVGCQIFYTQKKEVIKVVPL